MPTLLDYRRRIRSVKNTQQITRAMKFVSAAKLRRAQEGVFRARPYAKEIRRVLRSAMQRISEPQHALLERRAEQRILVLVLTSDKGLCGAFSTNVLRKTYEYLREQKGKDVQVMAGGPARRGKSETAQRETHGRVAKRVDARGIPPCRRNFQAHIRNLRVAGSRRGLRDLQRIQERGRAAIGGGEAAAARSRAVLA